ncbi:MalY/PatB family protein [Streptomyces sp. NPDC059740]|uniref:MalY/PatB family protein n=1 Tax=Streptomyces sp. NPDC059740 TaxID=3346926 RepID=UPI0036540BD2
MDTPPDHHAPDPTRPAPADRIPPDAFHADLARLRRLHHTKWGGLPDDALALSVAETDFPPAPPVAEALRLALADGDLGYAPHDGLHLPRAFTDFADRHWGWRPDPADTLTVPEVMVGIVEMLRVLTRPGDPVVVETPAYGPYFKVLRETGRTLWPVPLLRDEHGWHRDLDGLRQAFASGATAMLLCHPHNPTGHLADRAELAAVARLAHEHGVAVLADEIWAPLVLQDTADGFVPYATVAHRDARAVVLSSASKAFNVPGLKCALLLPASPATAPALRRLPELLTHRTSLLGLLAATAAFRDGDAWLGALRTHLRANRDLLTARLADLLPDVGFSPPPATYLAWLDLRALRSDGTAAEHLRHHAGVLLSDGEEYGAPGWARLNFATGPEVLTQALARIAAARQ